MGRDAIRPQVGIPAGPADPPAGKASGCRERSLNLLRGRAGRRDCAKIYLSSPKCGLDEMDVAVGEAGQEQAALQFDHLGCRPLQLCQIGSPAHSQDALAPDRHCLGPGVAGIGSVDRATAQQQICV